MTAKHTFRRSENPRNRSCVSCGLPIDNTIHALKMQKEENTQGKRLYEIYSKVFAYRHPLPWKSLPTSEERNLWEQIAEQFTRIPKQEKRLLR